MYSRDSQAKGTELRWKHSGLTSSRPTVTEPEWMRCLSVTRPSTLDFPKNGFRQPRLHYRRLALGKRLKVLRHPFLFPIHRFRDSFRMPRVQASVALVRSTSSAVVDQSAAAITSPTHNSPTPQSPLQYEHGLHLVWRWYESVPPHRHRFDRAEL
jgi:hypothetical protein